VAAIGTPLAHRPTLDEGGGAQRRTEAGSYFRADRSIAPLVTDPGTNTVGRTNSHHVHTLWHPVSRSTPLIGACGKLALTTSRRPLQACTYRWLPDIQIHKRPNRERDFARSVDPFRTHIDETRRASGGITVHADKQPRLSPHALSTACWET